VSRNLRRPGRLPEPDNEQMSAIPFTVIGGFLGAGKTTLLNHVLTSADGVRYAVLVNDFGAINIDEDLITSHQGETMALANGCICCSLANGFMTAMLKLMQRADSFDHIIVEASGVSNPDRIMDFARLDPDLHEDAIIILADALNLPAQLTDRYLSEVIKQQIVSADIVILNKSDLVGKSVLAAIEEQLKNINPNAPVLVERADSLPLDLVLNCSRDKPLQVYPPYKREHHEHEKHLFQTVAFHSDEIVDYDVFGGFINSLPPTILRGKGRLILTTGCYLWHRVGRRSELTKTTLEFSNSEVVVIGRVDTEAVRRMAVDCGFMVYH
jgi:G3E family GTPase